MPGQGAMSLSLWCHSEPHLRSRNIASWAATPGPRTSGLCAKPLVVSQGVMELPGHDRTRSPDDTMQCLWKGHVALCSATRTRSAHLHRAWRATFRRSAPRHSATLPGSVACPDQRLSGAPKKQDVAVRVSDLEAAQAVTGILQRIAEWRAALNEFGSQRVGIGRVAIGIPPHGRIASGIR